MGKCTYIGVRGKHKKKENEAFTDYWTDFDFHDSVVMHKQTTVKLEVKP